MSVSVRRRKQKVGNLGTPTEVKNECFSQKKKAEKSIV